MKAMLTKKSFRAPFLRLPFFVIAALFFIFLPISAGAVTGDYNKPSNGTLTASEWNNLINDFVARSGSALTGYFGINTATSSTYALDIVGGFRADAISGPMSGTLSAGNVSSGSFGSNTSAGDYGFPKRLSINFGSGTQPLTLGQTLATALSINGNVGIGTTSANALLHLYQNGGNNAELDIQSVAGALQHWAIYQERTNGDLRFWNNNISGEKNLLTLTDNGNVGIGTTNPFTRLEVLKTASGSSTIATSGTVDAPVVSRLHYGTVGLDFGILDSGVGYIQNRNVSNLATNFNLLINPNGGNVGVGTTNPNYKLDVSANNNRIRLLGTVGYTMIDINNNGGSLYIGRDSSVGGQLISGSGAYAGVVNVQGAYPLQFATNGSIGMTLSSTGNVGIGTTSPISTLDVNGLIKMRTPNITQPEDVINKSYLDSALASTSASIITQVATSSFWQGNMAGNIYSANAGNVGIGTSSPLAKLEIVGSSHVAADSSSLFELSTGAGLYTDEKLIFGINNGSYAWIQAVKAGTNYRNLSLNSSGGNVGIGTTTFDSYKLKVAGSVNFDNSNLYSDTLGNLSLGSILDKSAPSFMVTPAATGVSARLAGDIEGGGELKMTGTSSSYVMGNLGIGTANPTTALEILAPGTGGIPLRLSRNSNTINYGSVIQFALLNSSSNLVNYAEMYGGITTNTTGAEDGFLQFRTTKAGASTNAVRIDKDGNVGIGTTNPESKLEVSSITGTSSIIPTTVRISSNNSASDWDTTTSWGNLDYYSADGLSVKARIGAMADANLGQPTSLVFSTLGPSSLTEKMRITNTGSVGIGTTNPLDKLHVAGNVRIDNLLNCSGTGSAVKTDATGRLVCGTIAGGVTGTGTSSYVARWTGVSTLGTGTLYDNGTNVGIGTTNPIEKLNVNGNILLGNHGGSASTYNIPHYIKLNTYDWPDNTGDDTIAQIEMAPISSSQDDGYIAFHTANNINSGGKLQEAMRISQAGNVGIGTIAPGYKLDTFTASTTDAYNRFQREDTTRPVGLALANSSVNQAYIYLPAGSNDLRFYNGGDRMTILSGGNVGIGTTNPSVKLNVIGNVITGNSTTDLSQVGSSRLVVSNSTFTNTRGIGFYAADGTKNPRAWMQQITATDGSSQYVDFNSDYSSGSTKANWVFSNGNVGIGTTNPQYPLDISSASTFLRFLGTQANGGDEGIGFADTLENAVWTIGRRNTAGTFEITHNGNSITPTVRSGGMLTILQSGNVGIGTTNPLAKFQVSGDYNNTGAGGIMLDAYPASPDVYSLRINPFIVGSGKVGYQFQTKSVTGGVQIPLTFDNAGNVGIGTTNPNYKLDVNGDGNFNNYQIHNVGTPTADGDAANVAYVKAVAAGTTTVPTVGYWTASGTNISNANAGNVSIGTTTTSGKFTVDGGKITTLSSTNGDIYAANLLQSAGVGGNYLMGKLGVGSLASNYNTLGISGNASIGSSYLNNAAPTNGLIVEGNVGVGTTAPTPSKLYVASPDFPVATFERTTSSQGGIYAADRVVRNNTSGLANGAGIARYFALGDNTGTLQHAGSFGVRWIDSTAKTMLMTFNTADGGVDPSSGTERMVINGTGNVGIGTTNPVAKLEVKGVANSGGGTVQTMLINGDTGNGSLTINSNSTSNYSYQTYSQGGSAKFEHGIVPSTSDFYINRNTQVGSTGASIYIKKSDGSVGVGKVNPGAVLDVNGSLQTNNSVTFSQLGGGGLRLVTVDNSGVLGATTTNLQGTVTLPTGTVNGQTLHYATSSSSWVTDSNLISNGTNVGIGTVAPNEKLTIRGANNQLGFEDSDNGKHWLVGSYTNSNLAILEDDSNVRLYFQAGGNVGIGTTNPGSKLSISGVGASNTPLTLIQAFNNIPYVAGNGFGATRIELGHGMAQGYIESAADSETNSAQGYLAFGVRKPTNNITEIMRIASTGNVGIGTIAPGYKLDTFTASNTDAYNRFQREDTTRPVGLALANSSVNQAYIYLPASSNDLRFYNGGDRMTIQSGGNVGIGTTNPGAKLDVRGVIVADSIRQTRPEFDIAQGCSVSVSGGTLNNGGPTYRNINSSWTITAVGQVMTLNCGGWWHTGISFAGGGKYETTGNKMPGGFTIEKSSDGGANWTAVSTVTNNVNSSYNVDLTDAPMVRITVNSFQSGETQARISALKLYQMNPLAAGDPFGYTGSGNVVQMGSNVGIGITNPNYKLDVNGDGNFNNYQIHNVGAPSADGDAANVAYVKAVAAGTTTVPTVGYWTASGTNISNANAGVINIGTTTFDSYKLKVAGSVNFDNNNLRSDTLGNLSLSSILDKSAPNFMVTPAATGVSARLAGDIEGGGELKMTGTSSSYVMGNLGIGTTNPTANLHIYQNSPSANQALFRIGTSDNSSRFTVDEDGDVIINHNVFANAYYGMEGESTSYYFDPTNAGNSLIVAGNVGIGTTAPNGKLDVKGLVVLSNTESNAPGLGAGWPSMNTNYLMSGPNGYWGLRQDVLHGVNFDVYNAGSQLTAMTMKQNGSIGIGTTTPDSPLQVNGNFHVSGPLNTITFDRLAGSSSQIVMADAGGNLYATSTSVILPPGSVTLPTGTVNGQTLHYATSSSSWVTDSNLISNGTNVGIGTTNPNYKLDVSANNNRIRLLGATGYTMIDINNNGGSLYIGRDSSVGGQLIPGSGAYAGVVNVQGAYPLQFATNGSIGMTLSSIGNVGIGIANPNSKLHIYSTSTNAEIDIQSLVGAGNHWATYSNLSDNSYRIWGGSDYLTILRNGNIGIGTTNPVNASLQIARDVPALVGVGKAQIIVNGATDSSKQMMVGFDTTSNYGFIQTLHQGVNWSDYNLALQPVQGNVGVGTTNPGVYKLFVNGNTNIAGNLNVTGTTTSGAFVGPVVGTLSARNVSSGIFGSSTGGGDYSFAGNVGIGTTNPGVKLHITQPAIGSYPTLGTASGGFLLAGDNNLYGLYAGINTALGHAWFQAMRNDSATAYNILLNPVGGSVGIGTTNPGQKLQISGDNATLNIEASTTAAVADAGILLSRYGTSAVKFKLWHDGDQGTVYLDNYYDNDNGDIRFRTKMGGAAINALTIKGSGNVGIGTTDPGEYRLKVVGNAVVTGTLQTQTGSDFAEEFSVSEKLPAGTVVVMSNNGHKSVKVAAKAYDKTVVGIVSDSPSIIAGRVDSKQKVVVAMVGVVSVNVSNINGQIEKGDLLTTSRIAGSAMKADEFRPGTIIGKALENLVGNQGKIKVLVNLQ